MARMEPRLQLLRKVEPMATPKKSRLDELADSVTIEARPSPGAPRHVLGERGHVAVDEEREAKIDLCVRERQVPRAVAAIMVDTGYSKGTAFRIYNDAFKRQTRAREAAHAAEQASKKSAGASASA